MKTPTFRILTLFLSSFLIFQFSFGQENFIPGNIISLNGDTLKGLINYGYWRNNPDKISFKLTAAEKGNDYYPGSIKEFSVYDEIYISAIVQTELPSGTDYQSSPEIKLALDTCFLQKVIEGTKSLYYLKNNNGKDHFYIKQDSKYELLVYKKYFKQNAGTTVFTENIKFRGQLLFYLQDCQSIKPELDKLNYTLDSFRQIMEYYYSCTKSEITYCNFCNGSTSQKRKDSEKVKFELGAVGGMSLTYLKFTGSSPVYLIEPVFKPSTNLAAGLSFDIIFRGKSHNWSVYNELIYTSYKITNSYRDFPNPDLYTISDIEIGYSYLRGTSMLRYKHPVGKFFIFGNVGFSQGVSIKEVNILKKEEVFLGPPVFTEGPLLKYTNKREGGYDVGLGAKYKNFSIESRLEFSNGMYYSRTLESGISRYYFMLGYTF